MELTIKDLNNEKKGSLKAPVQLTEPYRPDLIIRAVLSLQSRKRQPYGADPDAGKKVSAKLSKRRRSYRGCYGYGISRVPRKIMTRRGTRMYWVGAFAPGTVGGRRAHPPKAEKVWAQKINKKENRKAIRVALSAVMNKELVKARGHLVPDDYPFIVTDDIESVSKTKELIMILDKLGFAEELDRAARKKVRAGKGKMRGRRYKRRKGPLLIVSSGDAKVLSAASNIPGVDACVVDKLNAELLAPGTHAGRAAIFTKSAIERLEKEKLFM